MLTQSQNYVLQENILCYVAVPRSVKYVDPYLRYVITRPSDTSDFGAVSFQFQKRLRSCADPPNVGMVITRTA